MANYTTYSFTDITAVIAHPAIGQYLMQGEGMGSITITMANDRSAHDLAADGTVMISKIRAGNGTITLNAQQTSTLHNWLMKWSNYVDTAATGEWARATITLRAPTMKETIICVGVSPQKTPDRPYQQQGQQVAWVLMAADIQQLPM